MYKTSTHRRNVRHRTGITQDINDRNIHTCRVFANALQEGGSVKAIRVPDGKRLSNSRLKPKGDVAAEATTGGAGGLVYIRHVILRRIARVLDSVQSYFTRDHNLWERECVCKGEVESIAIRREKGKGTLIFLIVPCYFVTRANLCIIFWTDISDRGPERVRACRLADSAHLHIITPPWMRLGHPMRCKRTFTNLLTDHHPII